MGFLAFFLGMYSSSGGRGSGSSLHSGELWLCRARVLLCAALLAAAPERIPVGGGQEGQWEEEVKGRERRGSDLKRRSDCSMG